MSLIRKAVQKVRDLGSSPALRPVGRLWRNWCGAKFIAVTGSVGKTTTKELIAACLAAHAPTAKSYANQNSMPSVPLNILRVRPGSRFAVMECGTGRPGALAKLGEYLRPDAVVITAVLMQHWSKFKTLDAIAAEKNELARWVRPGGFVWLNGDDPLVAGMEVPAGVQRRVFGTSPDFDVWASEIMSDWPSSLSFTAHHGEETARVVTELNGRHWVGSALAAIGVAVGYGVPLAVAADALSHVQPVYGRMQRVQLPNGVEMIRDDFKGGFDTWGPSLDVLRSAGESAMLNRRWVVTTGTDETRPREGMKRLVSLAQGAAERMLFIGHYSDVGQKRAVWEGMPEDAVACVGNLREAVDYLKRELRPGDLVLLKGPFEGHLARIYYALSEAQFGPLACWLNECRKGLSCDECPELHGRAAFGRNRLTDRPLLPSNRPSSVDR